MWMLAIVAVLGGATWLALRPAPPPPLRPLTWLASLDPGQVNVIRIAWPDGNAATISRESEWWVLRLGDSPAWPVDNERAQGVIRLAAGLESLPPDTGPAPTLDGPAVTFTLRGGDTRSLRLASTTLGGRCAVSIDAADGVTPRFVLAESDFAALFAREGVATWRRAEVLPNGSTAARVRVEQMGRVLELARTQNRWGVQRPVVSPANAAACADLIGRLAAVRAVRILDAAPPGGTGLENPTSLIACERDVRGPDGQTRTLLQEARFAAAADTAGTQVYAQLGGWWLGEAGTRTAAWGPVIALVATDDLRTISAEPGPLLSRIAFEIPPADVREVRVFEPGATPDAQAPLRAAFARTVDGWEVAPSSPPGPRRAMSPERQAAIGAILTMLCEEPAASATVAEPAGAKPFARVALASRLPLGEPVTLSLAVVPLSTGPQETLIVTTGRVHRVYLAAKHEAVVRWLREEVVPEG